MYFANNSLEEILQGTKKPCGSINPQLERVLLMQKIDSRLEEIRIEFKTLNNTLESYHETQHYLHDALLEQILAVHGTDPKIAGSALDLKADIAQDSRRFFEQIEDQEAELKKERNQLEDKKEEERMRHKREVIRPEPY